MFFFTKTVRFFLCFWQSELTTNIAECIIIIQPISLCQTHISLQIKVKSNQFDAMDKSAKLSLR